MNVRTCLTVVFCVAALIATSCDDRNRRSPASSTQTAADPPFGDVATFVAESDASDVLILERWRDNRGMFTVKTGWFWQNGFNDPNYFAWPAGRIEAASQALKSPREPYSVMWRPDIEVDFSRGWNSPVLVSINGKRRNVSYRLSQVANADAALKKFQRAVASKEWGPGKYACNRTNIAFIMVLGDEREEGSWTQKAEGVPSNGSMTTQRIVRTTRGGQTDSFGRPVEGEEELSAMVTTSAQTNAYRTFWLTYKFGTGNMEVKFAQDGPQSPVGVCVLYPNEYRL